MARQRAGASQTAPGLYALGQLLAGAGGLIPFDQLEGPIEQLLSEFGPPRKSPRLELPNCHLQTHGMIPSIRFGTSCWITEVGDLVRTRDIGTKSTFGVNSWRAAAVGSQFQPELTVRLSPRQRV
jgi:hypothetical protein